jgi:hypothetical protein
LLSFFRSNNPGVVVFYVVYLILFRVVFFFIAPDFSFVFNHHEPLAALIFKPLSNLKDYRIIGSILGAVVIFLEAILINGIYNVNKFSAKKTYLPGAIFIIMASFFKEGLVFSPAMLSSLFIALIVYRLFGLIKQDKVNGDIFDVGFLTALAALTYFPSALLIFFSLLALTTIRPFSLRDWIIVLLGFVAPLIPVVIIYFWFNSLDKLPLDALNIIHFEWLVGFNSSTANIALTAVLGLILAFSFLMLPSVLFSTLIQVRKFSSTLVLLAFFVIGGFFLQPRLNSAHWVMLALPAGILYTMALEQFKRKIIVEITHLIIILLILAGQFLPVLNII